MKNLPTVNEPSWKGEEKKRTNITILNLTIIIIIIIIMSNYIKLAGPKPKLTAASIFTMVIKRLTCTDYKSEFSHP